jgi:hypothetical protein
MSNDILRGRGGGQRKRVPKMIKLEALQHITHMPSHFHQNLGPDEKALALSLPN